MRTLEDLLHLEPAAQFLGGGCTERGFRSNSVTARMLICSRGAQMFSHTHPRPAPKSLLPSLRTKSLFLEKSVCLCARTPIPPYSCEPGNQHFKGSTVTSVMFHVPAVSPLVYGEDTSPTVLQTIWPCSVPQWSFTLTSNLNSSLKTKHTLGKCMQLMAGGGPADQQHMPTVSSLSF